MTKKEKDKIIEMTAEYFRNNTDYEFQCEYFEDYYLMKLDNESDEYAVKLTHDYLEQQSAYNNVFMNKLSSIVDSVVRYVENRWKARLYKEEKNELPYLRVGALREFLETVPDDMPVYYERIHDHYFEDRGWSYTDSVEAGNTNTIKIKSPQHGQITEHVRAFSASVCEGRLIITAHY